MKILNLVFELLIYIDKKYPIQALLLVIYHITCDTSYSAITNLWQLYINMSMTKPDIETVS